MAKYLRIMNEWRTIKELPSYEVSSVGLYCSETKRKFYRTIDLERVLKSVNIPNLSVTRLNKPLP